MTALIRYVFARSLTSQRWVPPLVSFALVSAATFTAGGDAAGTGAIPALFLVPVVAWMTVVAIHNDDVSQQTVLAVSVGSVVRARIATLVAAAIPGFVLGTLTTAASVIVDPEHGGAMGAGMILLALEVTVVAAVASGVALGQICARPIIRRIGFSWLFGVLACVGLLAVPVSPFNRTLAALSSPRDTTPTTVVAYAAVELAVAVAALGLTVRAYRRTAP